MSENLLKIGTSDGEPAGNSESEEALLYAARHGQTDIVKGLIEAKKEGQLSFDISCKGRSKSNNGWTALHLATYFGHHETVAALLAGGADVDAVNHRGDTPLHKAAFIGKEELVVRLLEGGADVCVLNGEGKLARDVSATRDVHRLLVAAERHGQRARELALLAAAREGDLRALNDLLSEAHPPSLNCVDELGNTCLHCAAYRGHAHVAVILLQNGIDTTIRNNNGKLAVELATDARLREVLSVRPVRRQQRQAARLEGPLLRRSRFLGWRPVWAVLQRGVLIYYASRAEATRGAEGTWRDRKYLDGCRVAPAPAPDPAAFTLAFSDGDTHRLAVPRRPDTDARERAAVRQSWVSSIREHVAYSDHYLRAGAGAGADAGDAAPPDADKPLGCMGAALASAANCLALLDSQLRECDTIVKALERSANVNTSLHQSAYMRFQHAWDSGQRALAALKHAEALIQQSRESDASRLSEARERNRVLEQALSALAHQHRELEMSVVQLTHSRSKSKKTHENDNTFYDAYEGDSEDDTLVSAGLHSPLGALSPWSDNTPAPSPARSLTPTGIEPIVEYCVSVSPEAVSSLESLRTALSADTSRGSLVSEHGHLYRNARSHCHRPSSQWSV